MVMPKKGEGAWIHDPEECYMEGRKGVRYWVYNPYEITNIKPVDDRLCSYPVYVFQPHVHPPQSTSSTPIVFALQGMAAPCDWNAFLIPTLLDMGIAVVLMDTPLGGLRSVGRYNNGNVALEISSITALGIGMGSSMFGMVMSVMASDYKLVHKEIVQGRHGLTSDRIALFGVSLGVILSGSIFVSENFGTRLLGAIGHFDIPNFARSYAGALLPNLASSMIGTTIEWLLQRVKPEFAGYIPLLRLLKQLMDVPPTSNSCLNPLFFKDRVTADRRVRLLVGDSDPLLRVADAERCAGAFSDGKCYVVPGLTHGGSVHGPDFVHHVQYFVQTQLSDWQA